MQEFDNIPMFMKKAPEEIDPKKHPELACLQAIIHDEDRPPEGTSTTALSPSSFWNTCLRTAFEDLRIF